MQQKIVKLMNRRAVMWIVKVEAIMDRVNGLLWVNSSLRKVSLAVVGESEWTKFARVPSQTSSNAMPFLNVYIN